MTYVIDFGGQYAHLIAAKVRRAGVLAEIRQPEDPNEAYADAMGALLERFPEDAEVGTLYGEALMVLRPWQLYSIDRQPEADTPKITAALERVLEMHPNNPGANHLYIHAVEPGLEPERALAAADRLRNQIPVSGHMNHMPSHIYVQTGDWEKSIVQNRAAMRRDQTYLERSPDQGIQHMYIVHNAHMLAYSAMMVGQETEAMDAARSMLPGVPEPMLPAVAGFVDLWMSPVYDVQKRFGRWDAILAEPAPPEVLPITTAILTAALNLARGFLISPPFTSIFSLFLEGKLLITFISLSLYRKELYKYGNRTS